WGRMVRGGQAMRPILSALIVGGLLLLAEGLKGDRANSAARPVSHWVKQLKNADVRLRQEAAEALGKLGPKAEAAIPALTEALQDWPVRWPAARALVKIGPKTVPALVESLKAKTWGVSKSASEALAEIGPKAVPALIQALKSKDFKLREEAADTLGQ